MNKSVRSLLFTMVGIFLLWGITRAAAGSFKERLQSAQTACAEDTKKEGKPPTPAIEFDQPVLAHPGEATDIKLNGTFPSGMRFVWDDGVTVENEKLMAKSYNATIRTQPGSGPGPVNLTVVSRGQCNGWEHQMAFIGGRYDFQANTDNGWRISLKNTGAGFAASGPVPDYCAEFYQGNETKPFETRTTSVSLPSKLGASIMFSLSLHPCGGDPAQQMQELTKKMRDPNLSEKEMEALAAKFQQMMTGMTDMSKIQAQEEKAKQFGFNRVTLEPEGASFKGSIWFAGGGGKTAKITGGSMKYLGK